MKIFSILCLLILAPLISATSAATDSDNDDLCLNQPHGTLLALPTSCHKFIICLNGKGVLNSCGPFYRFNGVNGVCDHPDLVECSVADSNGNDWILLPATEPTLNFPPHLPKPQTPEEVVWDESAGDICVRKENGALMPKADSCIYYYVCLLHRPYRRSCPPMLHFNAEKLLCQDPAHAQCALKTTAVIDNPDALELAIFGGADLSCADMPDGILLPHEHSCEKFFNCKHGERIELDCPVGLHFSVRQQRCEWPKLAKCSV